MPMIKKALSKIFINKSKSITSAAIILAAASLASRVLGILRDRILAGQFGAGRELDIYYAAFTIPDLVYNLLVLGALSAGFIPVFAGYIGNKNKAWDFISNIINVLFIALIVVAGILIIFAPLIIRIVAPGFNEGERELTVLMTRLMFLSPIFLAMSGIFGSVLQSFRQFFVYSLGPIFYNLGIIVGALFLVPIFGLYGLAIGVIFGAMLHFLIQVIPVFYLGYRWRPVFDLQEKGLKEIFYLMIPRTLSLIVSQINILTFTIIGSTLAAGSIAIFNLANNIQSFPLGIFAVSYAIAVFPTLAELADNKKKFIETLSLTIRQILFFVLPSAALLIVLRAQLVRIILGSGRFDWEDTITTLWVLSIFAFSLFAQSLILVLARAFYALKDTKTPFLCGIAAVIVNIVLSVTFADKFGVLGLALAFSYSSIINFILLFMVLHFRLGQIDGNRIIISTSKIVVATFLMAISAQAAKYPLVNYFGLETFVGVFIQCLAAVLAGFIAFVVASYLFKSEELFIFMNSLKCKALKRSGIPEVIESEKIID